MKANLYKLQIIVDALVNELHVLIYYTHTKFFQHQLFLPPFNRIILDQPVCVIYHLKCNLIDYKINVLKLKLLWLIRKAFVELSIKAVVGSPPENRK